jgi:single-stranded-DNA-specific exonuclease
MINPKRKDSGYPFRNIAGVTVAFKLGWELAQSMLSLSDGEWQSIAAEWFPLVLLGTYGDKVPLQDENWTLAHLGFCALKKTRRKGLRMLTDMLSEESGLDETVLQKMISVFSAGKTEGWGENRSFRILTETEESFLRETITELVRRSDEWHAQANDNFKRMVSEIGEELSNDIISIYTPQVAFEYLGFCASRLKERYGKPIVAMSHKGDSIVGEARAPRGVNIHRVLAEKSHLFSSFGGHRPACGFTLERAKLDELRTFLSQDFPEFAARKQQSAEMRIVDVLPLSKLSEQLKRELVSLAPFGVENPPPLFLAKQVSLSKGIYTYTAPETGAVKRIEMKSDSQSWTGIDGKPIELDIVYYFNSAGTLTIADARPSLFNEPHIES